MRAGKSTAARTGSSGRSGRSGRLGRSARSDQLTPAQKVKEIMKTPEQVGWAVGFKDLTALHGDWISEMVYGTGDYTLQAHRGSYKSSCLAVAIALIMVLDPMKNIIFLRKTDNDVAEMLGMVTKILRSDFFAFLTKLARNKDLQITNASSSQLSTNLWTSPMGAPQLLGLGIKSSITGKHAWYVITDDICNKDDRESRAERERTKRQYDELQNIRNKGGRIINLGTPWHKEDVFSKMPNIWKYDCYKTELISKEQLEQLRQSMRIPARPVVKPALSQASTRAAMSAAMLSACAAANSGDLPSVTSALENAGKAGVDGIHAYIDQRDPDLFC